MTAWKFRGNSGDPVEKRRRELEEQQRQLSEQMSQLEEKLHLEKNPPPVEPGPPVWRMEEEASFVREEPQDPPRTKRVLRAQRQRDFRLFLFLFLGLAIIVTWLIHTFV